jgi:hypothetical protein
MMQHLRILGCLAVIASLNAMTPKSAEAQVCWNCSGQYCYWWAVIGHLDGCIEFQGGCVAYGPECIYTLASTSLLEREGTLLIQGDGSVLARTASLLHPLASDVTTNALMHGAAFDNPRPGVAYNRSCRGWITVRAYSAAEGERMRRFTEQVVL